MIHDVWFDERLTYRWDTTAGTLTTFTDGTPQTRPMTAAEVAHFAEDLVRLVAGDNRLALLDRARAALAGNQTFLDLTTPTNAQVVAQVRALTRQTSGLIKLIAEDLADLNGT